MRKATGSLLLIALGIATVGCRADDGTPTASGSRAAPVESQSGYNPVINPADFVDAIDNPYVAFGSGVRTTYRGESDGETETIDVRVTGETKVIMGITCTVVEDIVTVDGEIAEKTFDWYAQDRNGNVWYFGEDSTEYENGKPASKAGSWEAGKDGALPGILMKAAPGVGDLYRQEYYVGEAEDLAEVLSITETLTVDGKKYADVLLTREWTNLDPGVLEVKYYAKGTGLIREKAVAGGDSLIDLVDIKRG